MLWNILILMFKNFPSQLCSKKILPKKEVSKSKTYFLCEFSGLQVSLLNQERIIEIIITVLRKS
jgi:hypothetical protein